MLTLSSALPGLSGRDFDLKTSVETCLAQTGVRFDSVDTAFFLRDLTTVMARTFDRKYPSLVARQMIPVGGGVDPAAESYVWRSYDKTAAAAVIDSFAADMPAADVKGKEFTSRIISIGSSYNYNIMQLRRSNMAGGIPFETRMAFAAREALERAVEQMAFFGLQQAPGTGAAQALINVPATYNTTDPAMSGFTNFPGLTVNTTTNTWYVNPTTAPAMSTISVATLVGDWNALFNTVRTASLGIHIPNAVAMPLSMHSALLGAPRSTTFTEDTLLQYLLKMRPEIKNVYFTPMLENAGLKQDGTTRGPRMIMWEKNDENCEMVIPQEFEQFPPQMVNMAFKVPCHLRFGGLRFSYPAAFVALDGTAG